MTLARQSAGSPRVATTSGRTPAVFLIRLRCKYVGHERTVGELADAAGRIAGDPLPQASIMNIATVGISRQPFAGSEAVAADMMEREPAVGATDCEAAPVSGDQHIRQRLARRPEDGLHRWQEADPAQWRFQ
jgi:hypothetical protein